MLSSSEGESNRSFPRSHTEIDVANSADARCFPPVLSYEFWKKTAIEFFGVDKARENRQAIYLGASGIAEFFADIALCPLEATRIRLVSQPTFANGLAGGFARIAREEGVAGFYAG